MKKNARTHAAVALLLALIAALCPADAAAQERGEPGVRFDFYARGPYREAVPRPRDLLRYDVGDFHTNYAMMERVVQAIAAAAPERVRVFDIGLTNEYRMQHLVAVSSPENIARLDEIKANLKRLSDPRTLSDAEAQRLISQTPVVLWLQYTIHGNESASFEAMMQVLYQLAASDEPATLDILKNSVALINVCANPDGHERFVTWYNSFGVGNAEPSAAEHDEPWSVYGRVNRYRFDLNRDNVATSQAETRNMQRAFLEWNPQVAVDHHGQPSQFFFPPAALPVNPNLPPEQTERWLTTFGRANAAQFDQRNWDFYVRDVFDLFYPGYWDSWPSLQGATGMTYETDGGGWKGLRWKRDDETIVTLRNGIEKHFVASLTTLATAAANREARLRDFYEFKRTAVEEGRTGRVRRFVILPGRDPGAAAELVENLLRAGVEVRRATAPFRALRAHDYSGIDSPAAARDFPAGAYVVDLAQPEKRIAKALLEVHTPQDEAFQREQLARFARNERRGRSGAKEEYGFYDITSWSLPLAFGVEAFWTEDDSEVQGSPVQLPPPPAPGARVVTETGITYAHPTLSPNVLGSAIAPVGGVTGRAQVAYIIPYESNGAASLVYRLLREGFKLAVSTKTLNAGGRDWPRGTVVARVSRNPETLHERIAELARDTGVVVTAAGTGFPETGETGVGSETVVSLRRPKIVVAADEPVSTTGYGAMWWTFDRMGVDFTPMTIDAIKNAKLDNYNVIILPDGSASGYFSRFGKGGVEALRGWVERGGTLVLVKGAAVFGALKDVNFTSARLVGSDEDDQKGEAGGGAEGKPTPTPSPEDTAGANTAPQGSTQRRGGRQRQPATSTPEQQEVSSAQTEKMEGAPPDLPPIASPSARPGRVPEAVPGAIFRATLDRRTPLTYGYEQETLPVLVDSAYFFRPSKEGTNAVVFAADPARTLHVAGFIWPSTEALLRGTAYVIDEPTGRGHVVLYAEDPNFRAIWRSTTRLFFNSFLFQPIF
ncbi:MAG TPA: M14 family zinc carboxypeptidase [Pyrinomonadaceae bacterium]|nr:M14 family zinc carboxypeptidase [Pyrinomonadaceae bacterium]